MRNSSIPVFVTVLLVTVIPAVGQKTRRPAQSPSEQQQQLADDKVAIEKLHSQDIQASLALDVPALEALWTDDIVTMAPGAPPVVGRQANAAKLEAGAAKLKEMEIMAFDEQWQEVRIQGDWAYEWGTMSERMRPFSGGNEITYLMNVVRILNRQPDGTWKIARSIYNEAKPMSAPTEEPKKPEAPKGNPLKD